MFEHLKSQCLNKMYPILLTLIHAVRWFSLGVCKIPVQRCIWFDDVPRASTPIRVMLMLKRWTYYISLSYMQTRTKHLFDSMTSSNLMHTSMSIQVFISLYTPTCICIRCGAQEHWNTNKTHITRRVLNC